MPPAMSLVVIENANHLTCCEYSKVFYVSVDCNGIVWVLQVDLVRKLSVSGFP